MRRALRLPYLATDRELFDPRDGGSASHRRLLPAREAMACVDLWIRDDRARRELGRWFRASGGTFQHGLDDNRRHELLADWLRRQFDLGLLSVAELRLPPPLPPAPVPVTEPVRRTTPPTDSVVEDVFVLAAEVKLIGDTPLIRHAVRILDPDTGEVVGDAETDGAGIVRVEVPAQKIYAIEIVDRYHDPPVSPTIHLPQAVLRCRFVEPGGAPVPHLEVTVEDPSGNSAEAVADGDGLLELPARLCVYKLRVGDETHWVHALLGRDEADVYEIVVASEEEDHDESPPDTERPHRFLVDDTDDLVALDEAPDDELDEVTESDGDYA